MSTAILIRAFSALAIVLAGIGAYTLVSRGILRHAKGKSVRLPGIQPGMPAILYFTTPDCIPCKTAQRPALGRLRDQLGDTFKLIEVDAIQNPQLAREWGVLSVPTTFILDSLGTPRAINHGVAPAEKLRQQLESLAG